MRPPTREDTSMRVDWTTIVAIVTLGGLLVFGFWAASKVIKEAIDDIWDMLGF